MKNTPLKGIPRLKAAWQNSVSGLKEIWKSEEAFRIEVVTLLASVPLAVWIGETALRASVLFGVVLFVLVVEVLNTAIEAVVDRIGLERHELSGLAKDLGSLAVLLAAVLAGVVWMAAVYERFML